MNSTQYGVRRGRTSLLLLWAAAAMMDTAGGAANESTLKSTIQQARVTGGIISGVVDHGVAAFKGIPFAAPPVGALRWKAPQPLVAWNGIKKADAFAPPCAQGSGTSFQGSENCLYLNIWTAASDSGEKRPVMVWIYGGAFNAGATSEEVYDGTRFAQEGVVLVSIAYRLGPLGFLAHSALSRESGLGSGAYGIQDQIAALKWVKENIAAFGGDPGRVTIFGQSAGGISASLLAGAPSARGLFHRAISQSGGVFLKPQRAANQGGPLQSLAYAESVGEKFLQSLGARDLTSARQIPVEPLLEAASGSPPKFSFWVVVDGDVLPGPNYDRYEKGDFNDTPILIGFNSDDRHGEPALENTSAWFEDYVAHNFNQCPSQVGSILAAYPHATDAAAAQAYRDLFLDIWYGGNTWTWARLQSRKGKANAYVYYFDVRTPDTPHGAPHGADLPYVFGNFSSPPRAEDRAVSHLMRRYWINFAIHGDPNGLGLPAWPKFSEAAQNAMVFDGASSAQPLPHLDRMKTADRYLACVRSATNSKRSRQ